jgi:hypothetical protein
MAGRGRHVCRRGIGGRSPQVGGRGTAATQLLAPAAMVRHRRLIVVGEPWRRVVAGLTPSPRRLLGLMRQTVPGVRGLGLGLAVAAMGARRGGAQPVDQPCRERGDDTAANVGHNVVAPETVQTVEGGKGKRKCTMECVICTDDHFTNQCPLLRGPKPSVAYCAASDDNGGFFISRQLMKLT